MFDLFSFPFVSISPALDDLLSGLDMHLLSILPDHLSLFTDLDLFFILVVF